MIRLLARGATPGRAIAGGQGLEAITETVGRGGRFRHILTGAEDGHNRTAEALASPRYLMLPGDHGTAMTTPQFETAMTGFLQGQRDQPGS